MSFKPEDIPLDFLPLVLEHLPSRRDLYWCALVNRAFHSAAIPILYRTLDARIRVVVSFSEPCMHRSIDYADLFFLLGLRKAAAVRAWYIHQLHSCVIRNTHYMFAISTRQVPSRDLSCLEERF